MADNVWKTELDGRAPAPGAIKAQGWSDGSGQKNAESKTHNDELQFKTLSDTADRFSSTIGNILLYRTLFNNKKKPAAAAGGQQPTAGPGLGTPPATPHALGPGARIGQPPAKPLALGPAPVPIPTGPIPQQVNRSSETFNPKNPGMNPGARRELPGEPAGAPVYGRTPFQPTVDTTPGRRARAGMDPRRLRNLNLPPI